MSQLIYRAINRCYIWLPIICGCHCMPDRSFHYKGVQFPVCARCTGAVIGFVIAVIAVFFFRMKAYVYALMLIPAVIDGTVQRFTEYRSTNLRRFVTGLPFGCGIMSLLLLSFIWAFKAGCELGMSLR